MHLTLKIILSHTRTWKIPPSPVPNNHNWPMRKALTTTLTPNENANTIFWYFLPASLLMFIKRFVFRRNVHTHETSLVPVSNQFYETFAPLSQRSEILRSQVHLSKERAHARRFVNISIIPTHYYETLERPTRLPYHYRNGKMPIRTKLAGTTRLNLTNKC